MARSAYWHAGRHGTQKPLLKHASTIHGRTAQRDRRVLRMMYLHKAGIGRVQYTCTTAKHIFFRLIILCLQLVTHTFFFVELAGQVGQTGNLEF